MSKIDINLIHKIFMDKLRDCPEPIAGCYYPLFMIHREDELKETLQYLYETYKEVTENHSEDNSGWFYRFHKSIRQTDFYRGCGITYVKSLLTEDEEKQLEAYDKQMMKEWKALGKEGRKSFDGTEFSYFKQNHPEDCEKRQALKRKSLNRETDSINGYLDSTLWNLIHVDTKDFLRLTLLRTFKQHDLEMEMLGELESLENDGREKG